MVKQHKNISNFNKLRMNILLKAEQEKGNTRGEIDRVSTSDVEEGCEKGSCTFPGGQAMFAVGVCSSPPGGTIWGIMRR